MVQTVLSVAEKPSVAKELANIIGSGRYSTRNGFSKYNKIFEISHCEVKSVPSKMLMTSVLGHVMEMEFTAQYKSWQGCNPELLFDAPIVKSINSQSKECAKTIENEAKNCQVLMLWLDCDLEGENIAFEIIDLCRKANPRIQVLRARFSALIPRDIFRTLRLPETPNSNMNEAVNARQEIDLRLGAAFTRFLTLRCKNKYRELVDVNLFSYGPCQFPTLGFVVDRFIKIENFQPQEFWSLKCEVRKGSTAPSSSDDPDSGAYATGASTNLIFNWSRGNIYDRHTAIIIYDLCMRNIKRSRISDVRGNDTRKYRPSPMNTVLLQIKASTYCHLSAEQTMKIAEDMYQRGIVSYPRTETDYFKDGFELLPIIEEHSQHELWGSYVRELLSNTNQTQNPYVNRFQWPKNGGHDDQAHPPIHPTKCVDLRELKSDHERHLYELIVRHFLACCSCDAFGNTTTLKMFIPTLISLEGALSGPNNNNNGNSIMDPCNRQHRSLTGETFTTSGTIIKAKNYLDVYKYEKWYGSTIPDCVVGEFLNVVGLDMISGRTTAPPLLSESDLIQEMDTNKIGTDATIATHISTIIKREYVKYDESTSIKRLVPTSLGRALIEGFNSMGYQLNKPMLRAQMEYDCSRVAKGELNKTEMLRNCLTTMKGVFRTCVKDAHILDVAMRKYFHSNDGVPGGDRPNTSVYRSGNIIGELQRRPSVDTNVPSETILKKLLKCVRCSRGKPPVFMSLQQQAIQEGNRSQRYLHCPECFDTLVLPRNGQIALYESPETRQPHQCPLCHYEVLCVTITNDSKTRSHNVCPHCFSNPPEPPDAEEGFSGEFRCFACANPTCTLAGRVPSIVPCELVCKNGACPDGSIVVKKHPQGLVLGCNKFPCKNGFKSIWLPKMIKSAVPIPEHACKSCSVKLNWPLASILVQLNMSLTPPGVFLNGLDGEDDPSKGLVCLCCSSFWKDIGLTQAPLEMLLGRSRDSSSSGNSLDHSTFDGSCGSYTGGPIGLNMQNSGKLCNPDKYNAMSVLMNGAVAHLKNSAGAGGNMKYSSKNSGTILSNSRVLNHNTVNGSSSISSGGSNPYDQAALGIRTAQTANFKASNSHANRNKGAQGDSKFRNS